MEVIGLEGMRFFAKHGVNSEEEILGTEYMVDIYIERPFKKAAYMDDVEATIDYSIVYTLIEKSMSLRKRLIEAVAYDIMDRIKARFEGIESIKVSIKKCPPPLGKDIKNAVVILEKKYKTKCAKCHAKLVCYNDKNCWCQSYNLPPKLAAHLKVTYDNCLCANCLDGFLEK